MYLDLAQNGDLDYKKYWQRILDSPEETMAKDIEDGMEKVFHSPSVLHTDISSIRGYFK